MIRPFVCATVLILLLVSKTTYGQFETSSDTVSPPITQQVGIKFSSEPFFKNNEYFHPLIEGYTLPGFILQPRLYYKADEKFIIEAGMHLQQYSGRNGLSKVEPLFRAEYTPVKDFSIIIGWLKGTYQHKLIEPIFQWERRYTHPLEYGVQFLVNHKRFKLDTWIDWEKYIELNDPFQEQLSFGLNEQLLLFKKNKFELWFPIQAVIKHQGGQINSNDAPLKTIANWAPGIKGDLTLNRHALKSIGFQLFFVGFNDLSPQKLQAFKNGYGVYPVISAKVFQFSTALGYWNGHHYISSKGEPLLQSVSESNPSTIIPNRSVITYKLAYTKAIYKNISFKAYVESYYDLKLSEMDYDYGISMNIDCDFKLKKW